MLPLATKSVKTTTTMPLVRTMEVIAVRLAVSAFSVAAKGVCATKLV